MDPSDSIDVEVLLPVHNEAETIEGTIREIYDELSRTVRMRFIICEDGSSDATKEILNSLCTRFPMKLMLSESRKGYSRAVRDGMKALDAPYLLCLDSDGQCDPKDFWKPWEVRRFRCADRMASSPCRQPVAASFLPNILLPISVILSRACTRPELSLYSRTQAGYRSNRSRCHGDATGILVGIRRSGSPLRFLHQGDSHQSPAASWGSHSSLQDQENARDLSSTLPGACEDLESNQGPP